MFVKIALGLFAATTLAVTAVLPTSPDPLVLLAKTPELEFLIDRSTVVLDTEASSIEFDLHTRFTKPVEHNGRAASRLVERTLILCREVAFITINQRVYSDKDALIDSRSASKVYPYNRPGFHREVVDYFCAKPEKKSVQPSALVA
jgi:hypothetical protein